MEEELSNTEDILVVTASPRTAGAFGLVLVWCTGLFFIALLIVSYLGATVRTPPAMLTGTVMILPFLSAGFLAWTFGVWVIAPDRRGPPFFLAVAVLWLAVQWGPAWPHFNGPEHPNALTVMEWNVERFWGETTDDQTAQECVRQTLEAVQPDIISFLEVSAEELDALSETVPLHCVQADYLNSGVSTRGGLAMCAYGTEWSLVAGGLNRSWIMTIGPMSLLNLVMVSHGLTLLPFTCVPMRWVSIQYGRASSILLRVIWVRCSVFMKRGSR